MKADAVVAGAVGGAVVLLAYELTGYLLAWLVRADATRRTPPERAQRAGL